MKPNINERLKEKSVLAEFYSNGYNKGIDDAMRGIPFKLISHIEKLSSPEMAEWERGYIDGYFLANAGTKKAA